jgi:hypothetical protein
MGRDPFWATTSRVLLSPWTWLRVLVAAILVALVATLIGSFAFDEGASDGVTNPWVIWGLVALAAVTVPLAKVIDAERAQGRDPDPSKLGRLGLGLAAVALMLYLGFGIAGAYSGKVEPSEVNAQASKVSGESARNCRMAGEDSLGDSIYRCDLTLRGSETYPELEGQHLDKCFALSGSNLSSMREVSCDRLKPENGGKPAEP